MNASAECWNFDAENGNGVAENGNSWAGNEEWDAEGLNCDGGDEDFETGDGNGMSEP